MKDFNILFVGKEAEAIISNEEEIIEFTTNECDDEIIEVENNLENAATGHLVEMDDCEPDSDSENGDYFLLQNFNQPKTETALSEEIAKQIELECDKNNLSGQQGGEVVKEILQEAAINTNKCEDNKISQKSLENISENCEESQTKTDFGISLGRKTLNIKLWLCKNFLKSCLQQPTND